MVKHTVTPIVFRALVQKLHALRQSICKKTLFHHPHEPQARTDFFAAQSQDGYLHLKEHPSQLLSLSVSGVRHEVVKIDAYAQVVIGENEQYRGQTQASILLVLACDDRPLVSHIAQVNNGISTAPDENFVCLSDSFTWTDILKDTGTHVYQLQATVLYTYAANDVFAGPRSLQAMIFH